MKGDHMEYRSLEKESYEKIYQCFSEAFSDYIVKIQLSFEKFQKTMVRNGVDLEFSIGSYDGGNLVGFILNGIGTWENTPTVYDSGTGMMKEYRGKKHSKKMFEALKQKLLENNFSQYLLEVIQTNTPAYTLYSNEGFEVSRELSCFWIEKENLNPQIDAGLDLHFKKTSLDWSVLKTFWNFPPSWQNSIQAIERVSDDFEKMGVYLDNTLIGYGIFDPQSGEIVHIAVKKELRRKGVGSMLLHTISTQTKGSNLRILNIDKKDQETMDFFRRNEFINDVDQYEMTLNLKE